MKLSEAIRLGAMDTAQEFGELASYGSDGQLVATCALGSAYHASGFSLDPSEAKPWPSHWQLSLRIEYCPRCRNFGHCLSSLIVHLNDDHLWTREQIADWIEREIEAKVELPAELATASIND